MAFIPTPQGIRVAVEQELFGVPVVNVLTIKSEIPVDGSLLFAVELAFIVFWSDMMNDFLSEDLSLNRIVYTDMSTEEALQRIYTPPSSVTGGVTGAASPGNVALAMTLRTGLTGRSARGRIFLGGIPESSTTGNQFNGTPLALLNTAFDDFFNDWSTSVPETAFAVTSFVSEGVPRTEGRQLLITSAASNGRLDTQRRRLGS